MKNTRLKKSLGLVLAALTALSATACTGTAPVSSSPASSESAPSSAVSSGAEEALYYNKTGFPICNEPITITVAGMHSTQVAGNWQEKYVVKAIEEKMGIKMECTDYMGDAWRSQLTLMLASNALPDLLVSASISRSDANIWGSQGYFADILQYADLMPNFTKMLEEKPLVAEYETAEDGAIYGLTKFKDTDLACANDQTWINTRWLKNVGKEMPTTVEELYDVLKAFKEQDANGNGDPNDEIPLSYNTNCGQRMLWVLRAAFGIYSSATDYLLQADQDGNVYLAETTDAYKDYLKFLHKLYEEQLLDNTCFIQTDEEYNQKLASDKVGLFSHWSDTLSTPLKSTDTEELKDWDFFAGTTSQYTDEIIFPLYTTVTSGAHTLINANTKYAEAICRLLDYQYTQEGAIFFKFGEEGKTFQYVDDGYGNQIPSSKGFYDESVTDASAFSYTVQIANAFADYQLNFTKQFISGASDSQLEDIINNGTDGNYVTNAKVQKALNRVKSQEVFPLLVQTKEEMEAMSTRQSDISTYISTARSNFVTGVTDIDAGWDEFLATMDQMGLQDVLSYAQAAYSRMYH